MSRVLDTWMGSPLRREPQLLMRSITRRLGYRPHAVNPDVPSSITYQIPAGWQSRLSRWFQGCGVTGAPAAEVVFGITFPREQLIAACRGAFTHGTGIGSDIKLAWDFGRCHHAPLAAYVKGHACVEMLAREIKELMALPADGPLWRSPMDISIRAINWIAADALVDGALGQSVGHEWPSILWRHLDAVWRRLEAYRVSNNHYLANLLGLSLLGLLFPDDRTASTALGFARREWPKALIAQTYPDGGAYEASLPYHVFITEMALLVRLLDPVPWPAEATHRLQQMIEVIRAHRNDQGIVPVTGDDDSGRVIAVDHGAGIGRADAVLALGAQAGFSANTQSAGLFPRSGWWAGKQHDWFAHVEFGGVGLHGIGGHAHDDDFGVWIEDCGIPLIVDPGSYLYSSDIEGRNIFRSAFRHSTVRFTSSGMEPGILRANGLFEWRGRIDPLRVVRSAPGSITVTDGTLSRSVRLEPDALVIEDEARGNGSAWWFFHLHPSLHHHAGEAGVVLARDHRRWRLSSEPQIKMESRQAGFSSVYGTSAPSVVYCGCRPVRESVTVTWRLDRTC